MFEVVLEAFKDTTAMLPWLLGIYIALEILENRSEAFIGGKISHRMGAAPFLGALFGCMPQCGFSVIAATLYSRRCISRGTLLAVLLSTSDEAIPVILAQHDKLSLILGLLFVKVVLATVAGYAIDFLFKTKFPSQAHPAHAPVVPAGGHRHCDCHAHGREVPGWKTYFLYPLKHTLRVAIFIFAVSLTIGILISSVGEKNLGRFFFAGTLLQPALAVVIGLIPNCAVSVAITEIYLKGGISFGSAIAGLSASGGLGILVLLKENKNNKDTAFVIALLAGISLLAGVLLNFFF